MVDPLDRGGFAAELPVVPVGRPDAGLAVHGARADHGFDHHLFRQIASPFIDHRLSRQFGLDAFEKGDGPHRRAVVIAPQHAGVVRVRADDGQSADGFLQGEDVSPVLQQGHRLPGHVQAELPVRLAVHHGKRNLRPGNQGIRVHLPEFEAPGQHPFQTAVHVRFVEQFALHRLRNLAVGGAGAVDVRAREDAPGRGVRGVRRRLVAGVEIGYRAAVGHHQILESPLVPQNSLEKPGVPAAGFVVQPLVRAHDLAHARLLNERLERRQVGFAQVPRIDVVHVQGVAAPFGARVHGVVLGAGQEFSVFGVGRPLQAANHGHPHPGHQVRILAVGFLSPAPARVAEDVDIGGPDGQPEKAAVLPAAAPVLVVFGADLVRSGAEHPEDHRVVERRGHRDGLGEHRDAVIVGQAVQGLAPPVELSDPEPRNSLRLVAHQQGLLLQGQAGDQVLGPRLRAQVRILIRQDLSVDPGREEQARGEQQGLFHFSLLFEDFRRRRRGPAGVLSVGCVRV